MDLSFLQNDLVLALCWTLIHSLWQGLLLAIVIGGVMIATRRSHARKRYGLLTLLFFLFMIVTLITFVRELRLVSANTGTEFPSTVLTANQSVIQTLSVTEGAGLTTGKS